MLGFPFSFCAVECVFVANNGKLKSARQGVATYFFSACHLFPRTVPDSLHVYLGISLGLIANH